MSNDNRDSSGVMGSIGCLKMFRGLSDTSMLMKPEETARKTYHHSPIPNLKDISLCKLINYLNISIS